MTPYWSSHSLRASAFKQLGQYSSSTVNTATQNNNRLRKE